MLCLLPQTANQSKALKAEGRNLITVMRRRMPSPLLYWLSVDDLSRSNSTLGLTETKDRQLQLPCALHRRADNDLHGLLPADDRPPNVPNSIDRSFCETCVTDHQREVQYRPKLTTSSRRRCGPQVVMSWECNGRSRLTLTS
ncbi:hypothetical protein MPTK1_6g05490 [Marchantia polymorpha subsp. ruderalis]|uniref:Uncharacterized protein n=2 Tax=Marchantia polymorpha TaxID=3197 RepID=A0AAF6BNT8_MARPO|nr:hypothetical protein MARPO_0097s0092 [Marchantia polymorpha]BBN13672.1 hypothetical protein Mp_6g05490 [Marchantia polymorpha subsp. ruderalis]|eukprot:PTQ32637.1 hypothetical protein MARPO_0097s0092 [Marchantia polymorpha]